MVTNEEWRALYPDSDYLPGALPWPKPQSLRQEASLLERMHIIGVADIAAPLPPVRWLVPELGIAPGRPVLWAGYGYSGKSLALHCMALSVATGAPIWGHYAVRKGRALHLDYEQGERVSRGRYQRLSEGMGIPLAEAQLELGVLPSGDLDEDMLCRLGEDRATVLIDPWRDAFPKYDENNSEEVTATLAMMGRASEKTGCVFQTIHHFSKPSRDNGGSGGASGKKYSIRGSGGFFNGSQTVYLLDGDGEYEGKPLVTLHKDRIGGRRIAPFQLYIEGEEPGPLRMRRVAHEGAAVVKGKGRQSELETAILHLLTSSAEGMSASVISKELDARKASVLAAISRLESGNRLYRYGDGPSNRFVLKRGMSK